MKIGVDASRLTEEGRTGTQNYLYYLLQELAKLDKINKYILYFREYHGQAFADEVSLGNENFSYTVLPKFISWTQVSMAY